MSKVIKSGELYAVTDAKEGQAGAIVLWRLQGELDLNRLRAAWAERGLPVELLPEFPSPAVALRRACRNQEDKACMVRGLKDGGFAVVDVKAVDDEDQPLDFSVGFTARLTACQHGGQRHPLLPDGDERFLEFNGGALLPSNEKRARQIAEDFASATFFAEMGSRAVVTRLRSCAAMEDKLEAYEALLDVRLDQVRDRILGLRANLAAAALVGKEEA